MKKKDEAICSKEAHLLQARNESELIKANLHKARAALAAEIAQCKSFEKQLTQKSNEVELAKQNTSESTDPGGEEGDKQLEQLEHELEDMKERHKENMITIQSLWKEGKDREREDLVHNSVMQLLEEEISWMRSAFSKEREALLQKMQQMYDLLCFRDEQVCLGGLYNIIPVHI